MACSREYVCPDSVGAIVRDDCEAYRTRYESLKVQLSFSVGEPAELGERLERRP